MHATAVIVGGGPSGLHAHMAQITHGLGLVSLPQHSDGDIVMERPGFGPPQRFPGISQEPPSMRLAGGTGALVSALVNRLPPERLHLNSRVTRIAMSDDMLKLSCFSRVDNREITARQAILALPPRLLASAMSFAPALERETLELWHHTANWMAPHAKVFALYAKPFGEMLVYLEWPRAVLDLCLRSMMRRRRPALRHFSASSV